MTRRALDHHLRDQRAQALAISLLVMFLISILLVGVLTFTATNQRTASYSKSAQTAVSLADAGINNAASVLAGAAVAGSTNNSKLIPSATTCQSTLLPNSESTANSSTYSGGTVKWWGYFATATKPATNTTDCQDWIWTLKAKATVPNPTGPGASPIVKTASAQVMVHQPKPSSFQVAVWNTVYSPLGPTSGCDTSIGQGVNVTVPMYVGGNLCMGQKSFVNAPLYVGGYLNITNKQAWVGCTKLNGSGTACSTPAPITSAHVGNWCAGPSGQQDTPCVSEPVSGGVQDTNIYVNNPTSWVATAPASAFTGVLPPTICWGPGSCTGDPDGGWYTVSSPGPLHPCAVVSGTPPTFDTDTTMNDSVLTTFNLTPAASYTCKTTQGELSFNAATQTLTVAGTVFIDGNVTATTSGNTAVEYTGWGSNGACTNTGDCQSVIYASGDVSINSVKLCAVLASSGKDCDWSGTWDPNKKILIFASNGPNGITVGPSQSSFQGGLYATNTITSGQLATTEGPLVSGQKTVILGQQFGGTFPHINLLPLSIQQPPGGFWISPAYNYG